MNLPPFICENSVSLYGDDKQANSISFFYCSVCDSSFRKPRTPEAHCAGPRHVKNVETRREKKEQRKRVLEKQIQDLINKSCKDDSILLDEIQNLINSFKEKEEKIARKHKHDADFACEREKDKHQILAAFRRTA